MNYLPTTALLIDADDTLWENNIYFEQVREQFLRWMEVLDSLLGGVQEVFTRIEHGNIHKNGYGGENFIASLKETYVFFQSDATARAHGLRQIDAMAETVRYESPERQGWWGTLPRERILLEVVYAVLLRYDL